MDKSKYLRSLLFFLPANKKRLLEACIKLRYLPNIEHPKTYNEKVLHRKKYWENKLFPICADKLTVRNYVAAHLGNDILIPLLYSGAEINKDVLITLIEQHHKIVLKLNNDSGSVYFLNSESMSDEIDKVVRHLNTGLLTSNKFGIEKGSSWYSKIKPKIIIEKDISSNEEALLDYKFHVFNNRGEYDFLLAIDFDRGLKHRSRTFYDRNFKLTKITQSNFKNFHKKIPIDKKKLSIMKDIALDLTADFSYCRVDLYCIRGNIYFGEMTFAPGSGHTRFNNYSDDLNMGKLWGNDPKY